MEEKNYGKSGYKIFKSAAKDYANHPEKTASLIKKTIRKANKNKTSLKNIWGNFHLLIDLIKAWSNGDYKNISKKSIVFIIASILYFVSPIDIVPDFIVGFGILDDAAVLSFAIKQLSSELEKFKEWKKSEPINLK
ncbi:YkvA family protein [Cytobacillus dafuensis]|nr:YkvA family protein [Cytobacillus dafuensis]